MNAAEIYTEAITGIKEEVASDGHEEQEQRNLRYLNFNMQQTCCEIKSTIQQRIVQIDITVSNLAQIQGNEYAIGKHIQEKTTLNKILNLLKTGDYANT